MRKLLLAIWIALFGLPLALVATQAQNGPSIDISGVNPTDLPTIRVSAVVLDSLGQPVNGLTAEDFRLTGELENRAQIVSVSSLIDTDLPVGVVLAVDVSSSMSGLPIERAREAARLFIESIGPNDPVAILTFSNSAQVIQDFTTDKAALLAAVDRLVPGGETQLYEGALTAVQTAAAAPTPRRAVILLSDGAQYSLSGESAARPAAVEAAVARGVPIYNIGLGFGTDRTYLIDLADRTNALFRESPSPDELPGIYGELAARLRTQYEIVINAPLPADGTEYELGLEVTTPEGRASDSTTLRTPVPVPVIRLVAPPTFIAAPTDITADIVADDGIDRVEFTLDGVPFSTLNQPPFTITIDPVTLRPGAHDLTITAVDNDGDQSVLNYDFEVAALETAVTVEPPLPAEPLTEPLPLVILFSGQTPPVSARYQIDEGPEEALDLSLPLLTIDPNTLTPGEHELIITVTNEGGITTASERFFSVADLPPTFTLRGLENGQLLETSTEVLVDLLTSQAPVTDVAFAVNGAPLDNAGRAPGSLVLEAAQLLPGPSTLSITVTNEIGQSSTTDVDFTVAALAPTVSISGLEAGTTLYSDALVTVEAGGQTPITTITYQLDGQPLAASESDPAQATIDILSIEPGDHILTVTVTNAGGQTTETVVAFIVAVEPSLTVTALAPTVTPIPSETPVPTNTPEPSATLPPDLAATAAQDAAVAQATGDAQATADMAAAESAATAEALVTVTGEAAMTLDAQQQAAADATATREAGATQSALAAQAAQTDVANVRTTLEVQQQMTQEARATSDALATTEALATVDARATANALATLDMLATENAQAQATTDAQSTIAALATQDVQATENAQAQATADAEATAAAQATQAVLLAATEAQATVNARVTADFVQTVNAQATEVTAAEQATATTIAQSTATEAAVQSALMAQATSDAEGTADAQSTANAQATADTQATSDAQGTADAQSTADAQATTDAQAVVEPTESATEEDTPETEEPTAVAQAVTEVPPTTTSATEDTSTPTATPTLIPAQAETAPESSQNTQTVLLLALGGGLLLLIIIFLILSRARRRNTNR